MRTYLISASALFALCIFFNTVSGEKACNNQYISVTQGAGNPMPNGTPTWNVDIVNSCPTKCSIAQIHLTCGDFSSDTEINPKLFRRLSNNDCLVNNGDPLKAGDSVSFSYAQTREYPMAVSSVKCV